MEPEIDFRIQGLLPKLKKRKKTVRKQLIARLAHAVMHHPNTDALIADLESNSPVESIQRGIKSDESHVSNSAKSVSKIQCRCCLKYCTEGTVHCDCGTWLVPTDLTRKWNRERFDALTILNFVIEKGGSRGARRGQSEAQRGAPSSKSLLQKSAQKRIQKLFFNASKDVKLLEVRNEISDEMVSFASTRTKLQKKTTHTLRHLARTTKLRKGMDIVFKQPRTCGTMKSRPDYRGAVR